MFNRTKLVSLLGVLSVLAWGALSGAVAATVDLPDGSKLDLEATCPVCGMKMTHGDVGPAAVVFKDGKVVGFDANGDLFRYVLAPEKYGFEPSAIKNLYVTDRGTKKFIEAKQAFYVIGTDIEADMGPEPIPFAKKEDAEKFMAEKKGKKVAGYAEVTVFDLKSAKKTLKMKH
jgi:nitrous oxide reductase accessory protein NosL